MSEQASAGNYFEDLTTGLELEHAVPRTITEGDTALYIALTGDRHPLHCNAEFARRLGFERETVNDLLVFHIVFGKSVPDVSLNAVANLGYADLRFGAAVYPGDTLSAHSTVLGRRESRGGENGVVWVRTIGRNQHGDEVLSYVRWVLVNKREPETPTGADDAPETPTAVAPGALHVPEQLKLDGFDATVTAGARGGPTTSPASASTTSRASRSRRRSSRWRRGCTRTRPARTSTPMRCRTADSGGG